MQTNRRNIDRPKSGNAGRQSKRPSADKPQNRRRLQKCRQMQILSSAFVCIPSTLRPAVPREKNLVSTSLGQFFVFGSTRARARAPHKVARLRRGRSVRRRARRQTVDGCDFGVRLRRRLGNLAAKVLDRVRVVHQGGVGEDVRNRVAVAALVRKRGVQVVQVCDARVEPATSSTLSARAPPAGAGARRAPRAAAWSRAVVDSAPSATSGTAAYCRLTRSAGDTPPASSHCRQTRRRRSTAGRRRSGRTPRTPRSGAFWYHGWSAGSQTRQCRGRSGASRPRRRRRAPCASAQCWAPP